MLDHLRTAAWTILATPPEYRRLSPALAGQRWDQAPDPPISPGATFAAARLRRQNCAQFSWNTDTNRPSIQILNI
jgi:hypothetical protein